MTNKQKSEKIAKILETVAEHIRDPDINKQIWEQEEPALQTLVAQLSVFLKRLTEIANDEPRRSLRKPVKRLKAAPKGSASAEDEWPDVISD